MLPRRKPRPVAVGPLPDGYHGPHERGHPSPTPAATAPPGERLQGAPMRSGVEQSRGQRPRRTKPVAAVPVRRRVVETHGSAQVRGWTVDRAALDLRPHLDPLRAEGPGQYSK